MKGINTCEKCGIEFEWIRTKTQVIPKYCSMKCRGHTGFIPGGNFRTSEETEEEKKQRVILNLEKHIIKKDGCWDWKGNVEKNGYARISLRDIPFRHAHVASYVIHKGQIPEGLQVNHLCHKRTCCNPSHLYVGTQAENMRDKILANRQAKGSKNGNSKLNENNVEKIKNLLKNGESETNIAEMFGVTSTQIRNIKLNKQWKHLEEPCN